MGKALISALLLLWSHAYAYQDPDTDLIDNFISKQAEHESGDEYREAREVLAGDINGDGAADVAVLYTIEGQNGTNNYVQYLAVFVRVNGQLTAVTHTPVGGKSRRAAKLKSISKNVITFTTLNYAPGDGSCCPSKKGMARYALVKGKLKEL